MSKSELQEAAFAAVVNGDSDAAQGYARQWLALGLAPLDLIDAALTPGIAKVGQLWEEGDYFLPELAAGAEAMKAAMQVLDPAMVSADPGHLHRPVVIGTVFGDIHDIGKSLVATMLRANGFNVIDLGADVPAIEFLKASSRNKAHLICISALLTTTMIGIMDVIAVFRQAGLRDSVKFLVGGAPITREWALGIGADGYGDNAVTAVREAKLLIEGM